jgi:hypothetical protein
MRAAVYRNLDKNFHILGFSIAELVLLSLVLVLGGELSQIIGVHRVWSFLATAVLALSLVWLRRSLGEVFVRRLVRFLAIPGQLRPQLIDLGRRK